MNVLDQPQVRPDSLFALVRLSAKLGSNAREDTIRAWMVPGSLPPGTEDDEFVLVKRLRLNRRIGADLGFFEGKTWCLSRREPNEWSEFCDAAHDGFFSDAGECDVLDAYATAVVHIERDGPKWLAESKESISDHIRDDLAREGPAGETAVFNETRWVPWLDWIAALGLGLPGDERVARLLVDPTPRLSRLLLTRDPFASRDSMTADEFVDWVASVAPYLDGGPRWNTAWHRARERQGRHLSRVLSNAMRSLHARGEIELEFAGGDRSDVRILASDDLETQAVASVRSCRRTA